MICLSCYCPASFVRHAPVCKGNPTSICRNRSKTSPPASVAGLRQLACAANAGAVGQSLFYAQFCPEKSPMLTLLTLGFLIGIAHAFEADHLAAVSSLVSGRSNWRVILRHGVIWGLGHWLTLLLVAGPVLLLGLTLPDQLAVELELLVGVMLVGLGAHVLYRLNRDRVHFHRHSHQDGTTHLHLHSHAGEPAPHRPAAHRHGHPDHAALRVLVVGVMHGLAGSAALVLVAAASLHSAAAGFGYILLFGLGSVLGMALVSVLIALPLSYTAKYLTRANTALQITIGVLTFGIGAATIHHTAGVLLS